MGVGQPVGEVVATLRDHLNRQPRADLGRAAGPVEISGERDDAGAAGVACDRVECVQQRGGGDIGGGVIAEVAASLVLACPGTGALATTRP